MTESLARVAASCQRILDGLGVEVVVAGGAMPADGGVVLMWNQCSHLDHLILPTVIPRPFFSLFNTEIMNTPVYGAYLRRTGHEHLDRHHEPAWRAAVSRAARRVAAGEVVLISPEGTRSWDGNLLPMKRGAFILALESKSPIVCVTLAGAERCLPRGAFVVRAGRASVAFSEPIETRDPGSDRARLKRLVASEFERQLRRLRGTA